jgi:hypothetical protein
LESKFPPKSREETNLSVEKKGADRSNSKLVKETLRPDAESSKQTESSKSGDSRKALPGIPSDSPWTVANNSPLTLIPDDLKKPNEPGKPPDRPNCETETKTDRSRSTDAEMANENSKAGEMIGRGETKRFKLGARSFEKTDFDAPASDEIQNRAEGRELPLPFSSGCLVCANRADPPNFMDSHNFMDGGN